MITAWFLTVLVSAPAPCAQATLTARLDPSTRTVVGELRCAGRLPEGLSLALYPRAIETDEGLDDINSTWFYPEGFDDPRLEVAVHAAEPGVSAGGTAGPPIDLASSSAVVPLPDGTQDLLVHFSFRVPRRNGLLGLRDGTYYLLAGWHPAFVVQGRLAPMALRYTLEVPRGHVGFAARTPIARRRDVQTVRGEHVGHYVPWLVTRHAHVAPTTDALLVEPKTRASARTRTRPDVLPHGDVTSVLDDRAHRELADTLRVGALTLADHGLAAPPPLVVVGPLREHLVEPFDGGFMVSDRAFHLVDLELFFKFHRLAVWRAQFGTAAKQLAARRPEVIPPELVADAVAVALVDELARGLYGEVAYVPELLEAFAVIPEIDALIFAPQIPFTDAYYAAIDETPRRRWRPDDFATLLPRGKLLHEKLVDLAGREVVQAVTREFVRGRGEWSAIASQAVGRDVPAYLAQWLGPYPRVDYALHTIASTQEGVRVEVQQRGPDAGRLTEPVTVEVQSEAGSITRATRMGPGVVELALDENPEIIRLDPEGRLVELDHEHGYGPRFNNREPPKWRPLLNNITGLFAVTNRQVSAAVDFSLRRIHDQRRHYGLVAAYSPTGVGAGASASYSFGKEITPLSLAHAVGVGVGYQRLLVEGIGTQAGHQASAVAYYGTDDRMSPYFAFSGQGVNAAAAVGYGSPDEGDTYRFYTAGVGAFRLFPLTLGHSILGRVRLDWVSEDTPLQNQLRLGGRYRGGRGYESDEVYAHRRGLASLEYRHLLEGDARTDFLGVFTWTRLEGALFADAIAIPSERDGCQRDLFYDTGYGLRFIGEVFGVSPASLQFDIGVPLNRCEDVTGRVPFTVYAAFLQSFAIF